MERVGEEWEAVVFPTASQILGPPGSWLLLVDDPAVDKIGGIQLGGLGGIQDTSIHFVIYLTFKL